MVKRNPALEKREEKVHKDLDKDGERGESAAHRAKVLGGKGKSKALSCKKCGGSHVPPHPHFK